MIDPTARPRCGLWSGDCELAKGVFAALLAVAKAAHRVNIEERRRDERGADEHIPKLCQHDDHEFTTEQDASHEDLSRALEVVDAAHPGWRDWA
jgi:hypothetical protein